MKQTGQKPKHAGWTRAVEDEVRCGLDRSNLADGRDADEQPTARRKELFSVAEGLDQRDHFRIAGRAIENVFAAALGLDEARPREHLQVARSVGERQMRPGRQLFDATTLSQVLHELQPAGVTEACVASARLS